MLSIGFVGIIFCFNQLCQYVCGKMEGFIYGGQTAKIENFPHSAYMSIACNSRTGVMNWYCGSSIVNQDIILTAAHCVDGCESDSYILVNIGKENKNNGYKTSVVTVKMHEDYRTEETVGDIALGKLKRPLIFTKAIKRVALMRKPPYNEDASIAGWGLINEDKKIGTVWLQHIQQNFVKLAECRRYLGDVPVGAFCAGRLNSNKYVAVGDSGSALVVRGFIQIGLVSYKVPTLSKSLVVYTDVGYYYDWIHENALKLFCNKNK